MSILMDCCNVMRGSKNGLEVKLRADQACWILMEILVTMPIMLPRSFPESLTVMWNQCSSTLTPTLSGLQICESY